MIEMQFPVLGPSLPSDHGYSLYSALSVLLAHVHDDGKQLLIGPISGQYTGEGRLRLDAGRSRLRIRLPVEDIPKILPLAGKSIEVGNHPLRIGVPQVRALVPAAALMSRMVTIKGFQEPGPFLDAARRQLAALGIQGKAEIPLIRDGERRGLPRRRVMRIKDKRVVGFAVQVTDLTAKESMILQENGIGGRKKMGCGFFVPLRTEENHDS